MKKKYKLRKSAIIIMSIFLVLIIALIIFILSLFKTKSYSYEYNLKEFKINENYDDKENIFYYEIIYDKFTYNFIYPSEYINENQLIKNISVYKDDSYICLTIESDYIKSMPLCRNNSSLIDVHLVSDELKNKLSKYINNSSQIKEEYQNYQIFNTDNQIYIWAYKGFNYISGSTKKFIKIFDKDIYDIPISAKVNEYLIIPDYEQEHSFNKIYILNLNNQEVEEWKLKYEISFESYILGYNDKSIYIVDKKNQIEYELVPHRQKMRIVGNKNKQGIIYNENQSQKIAIEKLVSSNKQFEYKNNYKYTLENNTLYLSYLDYDIKTIVSYNKVDSIVYIKNDDIYYLVKDTLYKYNIKYGETKLITYSEWERNNKNVIFINDQN